jgi:hypothetical protein
MNTLQCSMQRAIHEAGHAVIGRVLGMFGTDWMNWSFRQTATTAAR